VVEAGTTPTVTENVTGGTNFTVIFTGTPSAGQVFVDRKTGKCIVNATDNGKSFLVDYSGVGSAANLENISGLASYSGSIGNLGDLSTTDKSNLVAAINEVYSGRIIQVQESSVSTSGTAASALIPFDDTIPQNTEGYQLLSVSITPSSASSMLEVEAVAFVGEDSNTSDAVLAALFRDGTANALAVDVYNGRNSYAVNFGRLQIKYYVTAGSTSATTFKLRIGLDANATVRWNGVNGSRYFGGALKAFFA
jgi:hypothetical protein